MNEPRIHVGMGGWDLPPFELRFYPPTTKGFRKLRYYAQFFDFVEINSTFYNAMFSPTQVRRWLDDVASNRRFVFTVKLFKGFTHTFDAGRTEFIHVCRVLDELRREGRLGGMILQFPTSFVNSADRRAYIADLARAFRSYRLFVEVRHASWNSPMMFNFFQECGVHLVNVDFPAFPRHMPFLQQAWNGAAYFRMMGRNHDTWFRPYRLEPDGRHAVSDRYLYRYSEKELRDVVERVRRIHREGNESFVVLHNDPEAQSLLNGFQFKHMLSKRKVFVPDRLVRSFSELRPISASVNVAHPLFSGLPIPTPPSTRAVQGIPAHHSLNY